MRRLFMILTMEMEVLHLQGCLCNETWHPQLETPGLPLCSRKSPRKLGKVDLLGCLLATAVLIVQ